MESGYRLLVMMMMMMLVVRSRSRKEEKVHLLLVGRSKPNPNERHICNAHPTSIIAVVAVMLFHFSCC
uniref:Putative secreted protein n=1 Tax=Anopheles darlingi TaxID=43151 RepID=A0A2M4DLU9_ANODA